MVRPTLEERFCPHRSVARRRVHHRPRSGRARHVPVIPILVVEQLSVGAVKRSAELFKHTWGENVVTNGGVWLLGALRRSQAWSSPRCSARRRRDRAGIVIGLA
jgi:hypothetical protein